MEIWVSECPGMFAELDVVGILDPMDEGNIQRYSEGDIVDQQALIEKGVCRPLSHMIAVSERYVLVRRS
ncbi:hypothetical protein SCLCIDRAFT_1221035 [Scleroderma citrinum Foug A]|uniref:Uncharacterized protein n=1 Tax=Scleroderma citrinum Foug A TaxID=1036808 RepID=A0A0C3D432_9AGAM|nr:hypothetical protein SCLCIDRAFT_1221035 [Scleroderma citrinum Foug A]